MIGVLMARFLRDQRFQAAAIGFSILILGALSWYIPLGKVEAHNFVHHLHFLPLMAAGMVFGWRGALYCVVFTALVDSAHIWRSWHVAHLEASDQLVEVSIFGMAGLIAGFLSDRERKQRAKLEQATRELEEVYQELQRNVERLRKSERLYAAGQLSARLAHEIRNPLASISGAAGILKRGHASQANVDDCLEIIEKESNRLNKLLTNFLHFARPRAPKFQPTDLATVLDSVMSLTAHDSAMKDVELYSDRPSHLPEVECDPEQLKQVLLNLLINAAQASERPGAVWLAASVAADRVSVMVRDQGCGISAENEDRIFDPFFTTKENGTGLGLAIASTIVGQHGGLLTARQNADRGMTFQLDLPRDRSRPL
jgi:signal transduction histidine kinase